MTMERTPSCFSSRFSNRRWAKAGLISLFTGIMGMASGFAAAPAERQPNLVLIVADDLGYADVGFHGSKDVETPHLDRLARQGVRSTNAYVTAPQCSPTRAGLMTGLYQQRFGYEHIAPDRFEKGLPPELKIMPAYLREAGYYTGLIGKWHLGHTEPYRPERRGFDEFFGFVAGGHRYLESRPGEPVTSPYAPLITPQGEKHFKGSLMDILADEAAAFIERNRARPFFLYVAFNAPHFPMEAPPELEAQFSHIEDPKRRAYLALVKSLDIAVGRVMAQLEASGLEKETLVVFTNDNGGVGNALSPSSNAPLRGIKGEVLEGGIRVPWLWHWPGKLKPGVHHDPIIVLDLLPTFLRLASAPVPEGLDGADVWPSVCGQGKPAREYLYWRFNFRGTPQGAVRKGPWKYFVGVPRSLHETHAPGEYLYNLDEDIGERRDVSAQHPEIFSELRTAYQAWSAQMQEPAWPSD